jgi:hypothetical protein
MEKKTPQKESRIDRSDRYWVSFVKWRQERIRRSLIRPLYQEALRSLFFVVILFVDSLFPLQLFVSIESPYNYIASLIVLVILLYIEMRCYNLLWGKKGRWSLEKYTTVPEKDHEEKNNLNQN